MAAETTTKAPLDQRAPAFEIPDSITVTLKRPITVGEATLAQLSFRPPTVREMREVMKRKDKEGVEATVFMLSLLSEDKLAPPDVEKITFLELQLIQELLEPFLSLKPPAAAASD